MTCKLCLGDEETGHLTIGGNECPRSREPLGETQGLVLEGSVDPLRTKTNEEISREWEIEQIRRWWNLENGEKDNWEKGLT